MTSRLSTRIETWVEEALDKHALKDRPQVVWEMQFMMTKAGPQMGLVMWMPSGIIGQLATTFGIIENPAGVTAEEIERLVVESLEGLRKARSETLAQTGS